MQEKPLSVAGPDHREGFFERLVWLDDRMLLNGLPFRLQHFRDDSSWDLGDECFVYFKTKPLIDNYARLFNTRPDFAPKNILEIGLWEGGSIPFWFEFFQPAKHVGIDISDRKDSDFFKKYVKERNLKQRIKTYWRTDQGDRERLAEIVQNEFGTGLDFVLDDASHLYSLTRASFETVFPLLQPGGIYIIEDWAWEFWPGFGDPGWPKSERMGKLTQELISLIGSTRGIIEELVIYRGFVVVVRGEKSTGELQPFSLEKFIYKQPDVAAPPPAEITAVPAEYVTQLEQDQLKLTEYIRRVEQDRLELVEYVHKVEQDRQLKLEEAERIGSRLKELEQSRAGRLFRQLEALAGKLRRKR